MCPAYDKKLELATPAPPVTPEALHRNALLEDRLHRHASLTSPLSHAATALYNRVTLRNNLIPEHDTRARDAHAVLKVREKRT